MWVIDAGPLDLLGGLHPTGESGTWREVRYAGQPPHLAVRMRFAPTVDGVAVAGVQVARSDGRAVTARDMRAVKLPPNWVLHGETAARWYPAQGEPIARIRKGPKEGGDDRHRMVWDMWCRAQEVAPRAPVRWMLPHLGVSDATVRRWVRQAKGRAAELGWDGAESAG